MKINSKAALPRLFIVVLSLLIFCGCEEVKLEPQAPHGSYTLSFNLEDSADVYIDIENRYKTTVNTIDLGKLGPGIQRETWDRLDKDGEPLLPGLYYLRLSIDGEKYSKTVSTYHLAPANSW